MYDEIKCYDWNDSCDLAWTWKNSSICTGGSDARVPTINHGIKWLAMWDYPFCGHVDATKLRSSRWVCGFNGNPCLSCFERWFASKYCFNSFLGTWNKSSLGRDGGHESGRNFLWCQWQYWRSRLTRQGGRAQRSFSLLDGHLSKYPWSLWRIHSGNLPNDSWFWRASVHGWSQYERPGRFNISCDDRCRCMSFEFT